MRFWFHYNRPQSRKEGRNVLTLHFKGACHLVHDMDIRVPTRVRHRSKQPHCVLTGEAEEISIQTIGHDRMAFIR